MILTTEGLGTRTFSNCKFVKNMYTQKRPLENHVEGFHVGPHFTGGDSSDSYFAGARPRERRGGARAGGGEGGGGGAGGGEGRGAAVRVALGGAGRGEGGSMARREWHGGEVRRGWHGGNWHGGERGMARR